jgi:hypothetical protein
VRKPTVTFMEVKKPTDGLQEMAKAESVLSVQLLESVFVLLGGIKSLNYNFFYLLT